MSTNLSLGDTIAIVTPRANRTGVYEVGTFTSRTRRTLGHPPYATTTTLYTIVQYDGATVTGTYSHRV